MTREEAIELLVNSTYSDEWQGNEQLTDAKLMAIDALKAEPVKRGEWIKHENPKGVFSRECSECKCWFPWDMPRNSFCPNCGAKMEGEQHEID